MVSQGRYGNFGVYLANDLRLLPKGCFANHLEVVAGKNGLKESL
jgi:hypothetical protein